MKNILRFIMIIISVSIESPLTSCSSTETMPPEKLPMEVAETKQINNFKSIAWIEDGHTNAWTIQTEIYDYDINDRKMVSDTEYYRMDTMYMQSIRIIFKRSWTAKNRTGSQLIIKEVSDSISGHHISSEEFITFGGF